MNIHFIGINGVSMRVLADICLKRGDTVTGSDRELDGHNAENVSQADIVVYTCAVGEDNCELVRAREKNKIIYERAEFLAKIASEFGSTIAIAGTHGKTTVTSMLCDVFACRNAVVHMGGEKVGNYTDYTSNKWGRGSDTKIKEKVEQLQQHRTPSPCVVQQHKGTGECAVSEKGSIFITEACEYKRNFLHLNPTLALILNAEFDHPDYYKDRDDYFAAFETFAQKSSACIIFGDDKRLFQLCQKVGGVSFGFEKYNDYYADNIVTLEGGKQFDVFYRGNFIVTIHLSVFGNHNVFNALAAFVCGMIYNIDTDEIALNLSKFLSPARRGERIGEINSCAVYSDYAHHPSEIRCAILQAKEVSANPIVVIFQPHTYSRTQSLAQGFASSLSLADTVLLLPIYAAREAAIAGVDSNLIKKYIEKSGNYACHFDSFSHLFNYIEVLSATQKMTFLFLGAGDIDKEVREFLLNK